MKLHLNEITTLLSSQDYLSYEKLLDEMLLTVKEGQVVTILGMEKTLSTPEDVDSFNRRMIQVHGIYGLI